MIFEEAGMYTTIQNKAASDQMAHTIANALVGNESDVETIEMTFVPAAIHFDEPTLIALTGADFKAYTKDRDIIPYKLHRMNPGETLLFKGAKKGTRVYMAIGGGIVLDECSGEGLDGLVGLIKDGDAFDLKRNYSKLQKKLLHYLENHELSWGVDQYALAKIYFSDVFHIMKSENTELLSEDEQQQISSELFEVSPHFDRSGFVLEGQPIASKIHSGSQPIIRGAIQLDPEGQLVVIQNDINKAGRYPQVATIADYHLPKLSQKKPGSKLIFKWIEPVEYDKTADYYEKWLRSLLQHIRYQLMHTV